MERSKRDISIFFFISFFVYLLAMFLRLGVEIADDGAFFLRYAENIAKGQFWVWNFGEPPIWGASAPLYPVLIAIPIAMGFPSVPSLVVTSLLVGAGALACAASMLFVQFGTIAGLFFLIFSAFDTGLMYFSGSGLETPLTLALMVLAVGAILYSTPTWLVGLIAGLLMVQKLDLVPVGALLLLALWVRDRKIPIVAGAIALAIGASWYIFAWAYFGYPVPNSFLTKSFHQESLPTSMTWKWFGNYVFLNGWHLILVVFSIFSLMRREAVPLAVFFLGIIIIHTAAYTFKFPFEPYNWYCMPAVFSLVALASIGFGAVAERLRTYLRTPIWFALVFCFFFVVPAFFLKDEIARTAAIESFITNQEYDRSEAGRWVNANTPADFVVYTMWGNPAYYSKRKILDGSFLNRKFDADNLIEKYSPEIVIMQNQPGTSPMEPEFAGVPSRYSVIKIFDRTYSKGMDYFFAVLARNDVLDKVRNKEKETNLMKYISNITPGDYNGIMKVNSKDTLFVHPGRTMPTTFNFAAGVFEHDLAQKTLSIKAFIDPSLPAEVIKRGGGTARLVISVGGKQIAAAIITRQTPFDLELPIAGIESLRFAVDCNSLPDSNWMLLSLR